MAVPAVNIVIEKGTDFTTNFKLKKDGAPLNLTGYTCVAKMRRHYSATTHYDFTATPLDPFSLGIVRVGMANSITSTIPVGRYVYDVLITYSGTTTKVIEGNVLVKGTSS
jgi:hypothetical protein